MEEGACADDGLSSKISGLSGLLSISSTLSLVLLVFPRPSKGSVWESTQTYVGAGTRALLGPRASAPRRRALRGAAQGGADVVSRFPLLAPEARCGALRTLFGVTEDPSRASDRTLKTPSRQPTADGKAQPKRSSSRPQKCSVLFHLWVLFLCIFGLSRNGASLLSPTPHVNIANVHPSPPFVEGPGGGLPAV